MDGRWYDKDPDLAIALDKLRDSDSPTQDEYLKQIFSLFREKVPSFLGTESFLEFPLQIYRRRWYDADPYLWITVNALKSASDDILKEVKNILKKD